MKCTYTTLHVSVNLVNEANEHEGRMDSVSDRE